MERKGGSFVSQDSLATSRDRIKGNGGSGSGRLGLGLLYPLVPPVGTIFHDPIEQRPFKADISPGLFALDPFVFQNLFSLGKEFLVENRVLHELGLLPLGGRHVGTVFHISELWSTKTISPELGVAPGVPIQFCRPSSVAAALWAAWRNVYLAG